MTTTIRNNQAARILTRIARANSRALNRAAASMNTAGRRRLSTATGLAQKVVQPRLRQERATPSKLSVAIGISGIPVREIQRRARRGKAGVMVGPPGARTLLPHAFIAKGRRGRAVFRRTTRRRGPLEAQLSEPLAVIATREETLEEMVEVGVASYRKNAAHELGRVLSGA